MPAVQPATGRTARQGRRSDNRCRSLPGIAPARRRRVRRARATAGSPVWAANSAQADRKCPVKCPRSSLSGASQPPSGSARLGKPAVTRNMCSRRSGSSAIRKRRLVSSASSTGPGCSRTACRSNGCSARRARPCAASAARAARTAGGSSGDAAASAVQDRKERRGNGPVIGLWYYPLALIWLAATLDERNPRALLNAVEQDYAAVT